MDCENCSRLSGKLLLSMKKISSISSFVVLQRKYRLSNLTVAYRAFPPNLIFMAVGEYFWFVKENIYILCQMQFCILRAKNVDYTRKFVAQVSLKHFYFFTWFTRNVTSFVFSFNISVLFTEIK